jgi:hypothetical protein
MMWDPDHGFSTIQRSHDEKMLASINRIISGPSANHHFSAASFYMKPEKTLSRQAGLIWLLQKPQCLLDVENEISN